jgi:hypothetical protein
LSGTFVESYHYSRRRKLIRPPFPGLDQNFAKTQRDLGKSDRFFAGSDLMTAAAVLMWRLCGVPDSQARNSRVRAAIAALEAQKDTYSCHFGNDGCAPPCWRRTTKQFCSLIFHAFAFGGGEKEKERERERERKREREGEEQERDKNKKEEEQNERRQRTS